MQAKTKNRTKSQYPGAHIIEHPNGTWEGFLRKMVDGKRKKSDAFTASSFTELKKKLDDWQYNVGFEVLFNSGPETAGNFINEWLEKRYSKLAPNTVDLYRTTWNKYLSVAPWKDTLLVKLTKRELSDYFNSLDELHPTKDGTPISDHVKFRIYKILRTALKSAVTNDVLRFNPVHFSEPPKKPEQAEIESFSFDEQQKLISFTKSNINWHGIVVLCLDAALREAELFGVRKSDFDISKRTLTLKRTVDTLSTGTEVKERLKTNTKRDPIVLSQYTMMAVKPLLDDSRPLSAHLFENEGEAWDRFTFYRRWKALLAEAGVTQKHFHALRHSCAQRLLQQGANIVSVSKRLGHKRPSFTLDVYGSSMKSEQPKMADSFDAFVQESS
jgi:integrase